MVLVEKVVYTARIHQAVRVIHPAALLTQMLEERVDVSEFPAIQDPAAAGARAEEAYCIAKTEYSWDHVAALAIEVYERIIRERAKIDW